SGRVVLALFSVLVLVALLTVPSVLLRRRGRPAAALSWLLALFALPGFGVLAWWAFGRTHLERKKRRRARKHRAFAQARAVPGLQRGTIFDRQMPRRAQGECVFPSRGNRMRLLLDGPDAYAAMEEAIAGARSTIHIAMYIWQNDTTGRRIRDLLVEPARAGGGGGGRGPCQHQPRRHENLRDRPPGSAHPRPPRGAGASWRAGTRAGGRLREPGLHAAAGQAAARGGGPGGRVSAGPLHPLRLTA